MNKERQSIFILLILSLTFSAFVINFGFQNKEIAGFQSNPMVRLQTTVETEEWVARYNGPEKRWDSSIAIAVDNSGNIYVTGNSYGSGENYDYATLKYDPDGNEAWVARYNGPGNSHDYARAIALDDSGNVYVTGYSSGANYDYATVKYDPEYGNELWVARYDGPGNSYDYAVAIALDDSGNVYVTGNSYASGENYDYATVKYDPDGIEMWVALYNGPGNSHDYARAIALDDSGNVYVTGYSSGANYDYATVKYDPEYGNELWVARYDGPGNSYDYAVAIALDDSGNVYVTGNSYASGENYDYATVKYDPDGIEMWVALYNGPGNGYDSAFAIALDDSGNVYVTGHSYGSGANYDYATVKYDPDGNKAWVARYNGPGDSHDNAFAIALDDSGNAYVTGYSYGSGIYCDYATVKYDPNGNEMWVARYNGPANSYDYAYAIALDDSGNVYVTGKSYTGYGGGAYYDYTTIKYKQIPTIEDIDEYIQNLSDDVFRNNPDQRKNAFSDKFAEVNMLVDVGDYQGAIDKLQNEIRSKCDGSLGGNPNNDWITDPVAQQELCAMIDALIAYLETLI